MVDVHLAQVTILKEALVIYVTRFIFVEFFHELLHFAFCAFHVRPREAADEVVMVNPARLFTVKAVEGIYQFVEIVWRYLGAEVLQSRVFDLELDDSIDVRNDLH